MSEPDQRTASRRTLRWVVVGSLALALVLRALSLLLVPNILYPDEVFQVLEPAHRLLYGTGVVPWEFKLGIRSWLFPGLVAGVMSLVGHVSSDPAVTINVIGLLMILTSLLVVYCATMWGYRAHGIAGAICCGFVTAIWFELVYFAPHTLTEVLSAHVLVLGIYLGSPGKPVLTWSRLFWSGVCLGLAFVLRFHIGPAIAVAGLLIAGRELRSRWMPLAVGGALVVAGAGVLDAVTWGTPFQSVWLNFYVNIIDHVAASWGNHPVYEHAAHLASAWSGAFMVIAGVALLGARRLPIAAAVAAAVFVAMSLVSQKDYRFIYPALVFVPILVGMGTAEVVAHLRENLKLSLGALVVGACAFWFVTSSLLAVTGTYRTYWFRSVGVIQAFDAVSQLPAACGIGLRAIAWWQTPGQSRLPPDVELHDTFSDETFAVVSAGFNVVIGHRGTLPDDADFKLVACWPNGINARGSPSLPDICLWQRAGGCRPGVAPPLQTGWPEPLRARYEGTCPSGPFCRELRATLEQAEPSG